MYIYKFLFHFCISIHFFFIRCIFHCKTNFVPICFSHFYIILYVILFKQSKTDYWKMNSIEIAIILFFKYSHRHIIIVIASLLLYAGIWWRWWCMVSTRRVEIRIQSNDVKAFSPSFQNYVILRMYYWHANKNKKPLVDISNNYSTSRVVCFVRVNFKYSNPNVL